MPRTKTKATSTKARVRGIVEGYRSGLEETVSADLIQRNVPLVYEEYYLNYLQPEKARKYTPDFILPNGIIVETKGRFITADRQKHLMIKTQHPNLDIRFVFSNSRQRISKQSLTTYAKWCSSKGFLFDELLVPNEWLREPRKRTRMAAVKDVLGWYPNEMKES